MPTWAPAKLGDLAFVGVFLGDTQETLSGSLVLFRQNQYGTRVSRFFAPRVSSRMWPGAPWSVGSLDVFSVCCCVRSLTSVVGDSTEECARSIHGYVYLFQLLATRRSCFLRRDWSIIRTQRDGTAGVLAGAQSQPSNTSCLFLSVISTTALTYLPHWPRQSATCNWASLRQDRRFWDVRTCGHYFPFTGMQFPQHYA